jgi:exodeoxyribonuclease VII small subunit
MANKGKNADKSTVNFEEQLKRLEEIVGKLESEEVTLDKALDLFEEGTAIVKSAQKKLKESQLKVQKILGEEGDDLILEDFLIDTEVNEEDGKSG